MEHKRRRLNFTEEELMAITTAAFERRDILFGKFDGKITSKVKQLQWQAVTDCVNCVSTVKRDAAEVRKKFYDMKTQLKKKVAADNKYIESTGGGPAVNVKYSDIEEAMLPLLSTTAVFGTGVPESEVDVSIAVGQEQLEEAQELCEIVYLDGTVDDLPGAGTLAEDFHNTREGPSSIDAAAAQRVINPCDPSSTERRITPTVPQTWTLTKPRTNPAEQVTSTPPEPNTTNFGENASRETRKRKKRSSDAPNHTMASEMLSVQREILANTTSMSASLTSMSASVASMSASLAVLVPAVVRIANAFVITEPLENP